MLFSFRIAIAVYFASPVSAPAYFGQDFERAEIQIQSHDSVFKQVAHQFQVDARTLKAIVFPEYLRYSYLSDLMESLALEQVYTQYGSSAADFSIGECQIKPSFAEEMEKRCLKVPGLQTCFEKINTDANSHARKKRIERLKNIQWQITYVAIFVKLACEKFKLNRFNDETRLRMLATLYNRGINLAAEHLEKYTRVCSFPNGSRAGGNNPYSYAEVALYFSKKSPINHETR